MNIIYKPRNSGKTTELVKLSAETNTPIVCIHTWHIQEIAKELGLSIPNPIVVRDYKAHSHKHILIDNAEYVLRYLIGEIDCMTVSKE